MNPFRAAKGFAVVLLALACIRAASAGGCAAPLADWKPHAALHATAARNGWRIDRLTIDDGCYVIKGRDADGHRFTAKLDPVTLDVRRVKHEGSPHEGERPPPPEGAPATQPTPDVPIR